MGILGLLQFLRPCFKEKRLQDYKGKTAAVDTYAWLHRIIKGPSGRELIVGGSQKFRYVNDCIRRIQKIERQGVKLIMVFDGGPLPRKKQEEAARKKKRWESYEKAKEMLANGDEQGYKKMVQSIDITPQIAYKLIVELKKRQIDYIVAPYEADAQLAYLSRAGIADFILTEDSDLLAFGAKTVLYKFDFRTLSGLQVCLQDIKKCKELNFNWFTHCMFLTMCILSGCDYLTQIQKVGIKTAQKIISRVSTFHGFIDEISKSTIPPDYQENFMKAFLTFRFQRIYCPKRQCCIEVNPFDLQTYQMETLKNQGVDSTWSEQALNSQVLQYLQTANITNFDFLGQKLEDEMAVKIAEAIIDPTTFKEYQNSNLEYLQYRNPEPNVRMLSQFPSTTTNTNQNSRKPSTKKIELSQEQEAMSKFMQKGKKNQGLTVEYKPWKGNSVDSGEDCYHFDDDSSKSENLYQKVTSKPKQFKKKNMLQFDDEVEQDIVQVSQNSIEKQSISQKSQPLPLLQIISQQIELQSDVTHFKKAIEEKDQMISTKSKTGRSIDNLIEQLFVEVFSPEYLKHPFYA